MNFEGATQLDINHLDIASESQSVMDIISKSPGNPKNELKPYTKAEEFPELSHSRKVALLAEYIDSLEIPNKTSDMELFILNCIHIVSDSWEETEGSSIIDQAIQVAIDVDEAIHTNNPETISDLVMNLYLKDNVAGFKRALYIKHLRSFVHSRISQYFPDSSTLANEVDEEVRAKLLESNVRTVLKTAISLFDNFAKTDNLAPVLSNLIGNESKFGRETTFLKIQALTKDQLHGISASILWQIKVKLETLTSGELPDGNITSVLNTIAEEIINSFSVKNIGPEELKLVITSIYKLIEFGEDAREKKYFAKNILIEIYNMPALKHSPEKTVADETELESALSKMQKALANINNVTDKVEKRGNGLSSYATLIGNNLQQFRFPESFISVVLDSLKEKFAVFLSTTAEDSDDEVTLLSKFYQYLNTYSEYFLLNETKKITDEFIRIVACDGRLFSTGAVPEEYAETIMRVNEMLNNLTTTQETPNITPTGELPELTRENYLEILSKRGLTKQQIAEVKMFAQSRENNHFLDMMNCIISTVNNRGEQSSGELAETIFSVHTSFGLTYSSQDWHSILKHTPFISPEYSSSLTDLWRELSVRSVSKGYKNPTLKVWAEIAEV